MATTATTTSTENSTQYLDKQTPDINKEMDTAIIIIQCFTMVIVLLITFLQIQMLKVLNKIQYIETAKNPATTGEISSQYPTDRTGSKDLGSNSEEWSQNDFTTGRGHAQHSAKLGCMLSQNPAATEKKPLHIPAKKEKENPETCSDDDSDDSCYVNKGLDPMKARGARQKQSQKFLTVKPQSVPKPIVNVQRSHSSVGKIASTKNSMNSPVKGRATPFTRCQTKTKSIYIPPVDEEPESEYAYAYVENQLL